MTAAVLTLWALVAVALAFDFLNGLHDAANSIATIVSTRVLRPRYAVAWAAAFNFIAFLFFGLHVAKTIGAGIVDVALVTGLIGAGLAKAGPKAIVLDGVGKTAAGIVVSPAFGFVMALLLVLIVSWLFMRFRPAAVDRTFRVMQFFSAAAYSL